MYIKNLKIINFSDKYVLQNIDFHDGVNFVVDTESSGKHNKVGKTTFLKLIDIAMGAQERDRLYFDPETNSTEEELERYIIDNQANAELTIVDDINHPKAMHTLRVGLFKRGHYFIDGKQIKQSAYRIELNKILFNTQDKHPTFRQLISSFVRITMSGDTDTFLRNLPRASIATYRSVYNFLFDISDPSVDENRGNLEKQLKIVTEAEKQFKRVQQAHQPAEIKQIISSLVYQRDRLKEQIDDIVSLEQFTKNRKHLTTIRNRYSELTNKIGKLNYQLEQTKRLIAQTVSDSENAMSNQLTLNFFDEIKSLIPQLDKSFSDLVIFNQKLYQNKI
ncbi:hypothetical protein [Schleiferilactobacillus perolens]|uniref:DUF2326 domain-containing protein n=1 Tax=Schleiferilactobacillus perolens DSM 12744 TaxID=1423792 RepID=A0A0R1MV69_9LACO|nr:hypothetical protein [Schleiferilactobacillus perolens]KRL11905.1 hypothetical protein FD09_GL000513 [Schleiferilactobacillus perolens DSM 12744]